MSTQSAHMTVTVQPDAETVVRVKVFDGPAMSEHVFVSVELGTIGESVSLFISDEETANRLLAAIGEARAKLVGAQTRAKQQADGQGDLPVAC